jgi:crooked neck
MRLGSVLILILLQDYGRALAVYKEAISVVPHKKFTFAKLWLQFARFHIRRQELATARKVLGTSIGMCPKEKLFSGYIDLELEVCPLGSCKLLLMTSIF